MIRANVWDGQLASRTWAWDNGRVTQTAFLFICGMIIGRKELFKNRAENIKFWIYTLIIALITFFSLKGLLSTLPTFIESAQIKSPLFTAIRMWSNFAFTLVIISSIIVLYYNTELKRKFDKIIPYGKMSLTNYITQSIFGSLIFYGWGVAMYKYSGHTLSFVIGIILVVIQYYFCVYWLKKHKQGPFESLWKKMTWINLTLFILLV